MSGYISGISPSLRDLVVPVVDIFADGVGFNDGSSTYIDLSATPGNENSVTIAFDGVYQNHDTFSLNGVRVTFDAAIPTGTSKIEARYAQENRNYTTIADNAVTFAKMASGTDGNVISYDASGNPVAVATGSDGQVLTSTGAGSPPAFETPAGGGSWTLINTAVASGSANLTVTGINSSTYDTHAFIFSSILPATSGQNLYMRLGTSSGIITATDYLWHVSEVSTGATSWSNQKGEDVAEAKIAIEPTNSSNRGGSGGTIYLTNNNGTNHPTWTGVQASSKVTYMTGGFTMGILTSASNIDRVQIYFQSGNITSGRLSVYGIAHA